MSQNEALLVIGMAIATLLWRYPLLAMSGRLTLPDRLLQGLTYVPPAVLTAIIVPAVLIQDDALWIHWQNPRIIGAIAALAIGLWRKNLLLTILVGMGSFLVWQSLLTP